MGDWHRGALDTPIGAVVVSINDRGAVTALGFQEPAGASLADPPPLCRPAIEQLASYFRGERTVFDLDLAPAGTEFEQRVWGEVRRIPHGATDTYGAMARRLGDAGAVRAVGLANARNPIAILIPCHRVVGADGDLTGYAGGLWRKRWLLDHEAGQQSLRF